jgi:sigma-B regulation protein RsbU (phosphoserine phosphatase)
MCLKLNRVGLENARCERFTTLFYGVLDSNCRRLRYCNAGHVPPILIRHDGTMARLFEGGTLLGVFSDAKYEENEIGLEAGDRLVLITDGITEAASPRGEEFGDDRLIDLLREHRELSAAELQEKVLQSVTSFSGQTLQDDATLMIVSIR